MSMRDVDRITSAFNRLSAMTDSQMRGPAASGSPEERAAAQWLPVMVADMAERLVEARAAAGLSARQFCELDRQALKAFCAQYQFTKAEVRVGQAMVRMNRATRRTFRLSQLLAKQYARTKRGALQ